MLLKEHYGEQEGIFSPSEFHTKLENFPNTAITFFSKKLLKIFLKKHQAVQIAVLENEAMVFPIYKVRHKNRNLAVFQSPIGAPASASLFEEVVALGAKNIIAVGCCGCLDKSIEVSDLVVPNCAIRDEGLSYHYIKPKDEIVLNEIMVRLVCESLEKQNQPFVVGKTWTTDGLYRETFEKIDKRKKQGAIVVEMETSALASVAEFRKINFAQILYGADSLAGEEYDKRAFRGDTIPKRTEALDCGAYVDKELKRMQKEEKERPKIKKQGFFRFFGE